MLELIPNKSFELMSKDEIRTFIHDVELELLKHPDQVELPVQHHHSHGVYGREMAVPAGTLLVGKIHKHENLNILLKGEMTVISMEGVVRVKAPHTFVSAPGVKRIGFAHEDSVWMSVHHSFEKEESKIEAEIIAKDYSEVEESWLGQ